MDKVFDIKWQKDLVNHVSAFSTFAFEGNVNDLQPVLINDKYQYLSLPNAIAELLKDRYCVVFFDHKKRGQREIKEDKKPDASPANENEEPQKQDDLTLVVEEPDAVFNSFSFFEKTVIAANGERIPNPNIALFKKYYSKDYSGAIRDKSDVSLQSDLTIDMKRIYDAMKDYGENVDVVHKDNKIVYQPKMGKDEYKDTKPFLFIIPDLSRFMTTPGRPNQSENSILMTLFEATLLDNTPARLVLVVDKMNDLPTWFEAESSNPSMKKTFIPAPDSSFRTTFFNLELLDVMDNAKNNEKGLNKFNAYTDKYSLKKLVQLKRYIVSSEKKEDKDLNRIDKTVFTFEFGINENPWLKAETFRKITNLGNTLSQNIKGQGHIIEQIKKSLQSAVTGVNTSKSNDRRPKAVFFLAGPTGTGKTEMCRQLAEILFGKSDKMIRFDMSEFKDEQNQSRLFGAAPGYVGYENGGELTKAIKDSPFSLLLFDEIEKANPLIWDKFLQILGDGRVTDGKGETVYFSETIIVFTSNLGITATLRQDDPNNAREHEKNRVLLDKAYLNYPSYLNENGERVEGNPKKAREIMHDLLIKVCDYEGISIKVSKEQYFKIMASDDEKHLGLPWHYFCAFTKDVVSSRIKKYFENISRREVLGRIGEANIMVYNFIDEKTAVEILNSTKDKFIKYLKEDNNLPLDLSISTEATDEMIKRVRDPQVLDLGGRGISMTVEKIISDAAGEFLFEIGKSLLENGGGSLSSSSVYKGELVYKNNHFFIEKR